MDQTLLPPSVRAQLARGGLFEGKYKLLRPLGEGSFATVLHARHEAMDREVALKFLRTDVMQAHPEVGERFLTEVRLASRLTNPHTVTIFDFGRTDEGVPFMVLEYVQGRTLDYAINKYGTLGLKRSIRIARQILDSLEEAHAHNIIHRDLKPANIMVGKGLRKEKGKRRVHAKVLDFGVAKLVEQSEEGLKTTESGRQSTQFIGTPRYMSPEQILGKEVTPASDLYSLGLIFYEMCTGQDSVVGDNVAKVAQAHLDEGPLHLAGLDGLPDVISEIIRRATARFPKERFQGADDFRQALQAALDEGQKKHGQARQVAVTDSGESSSDRETKERTSDVFSGRGYVELPTEAGPSPAPTPTAPIRPPTPAKRSPSPARAPSSRQPDGPAAEATASSMSTGGAGGLDLDMDTVAQHKREIARKRQATFERQRKATQEQGAMTVWAFHLGVIGVAGLLGFVIVGGALSILATPMRFAVALLPSALALMWALVSESPYRDTLRRVVKPWGRRSALMAVAAVGLLAVLMPETARLSLLDDPLWFMVGWPEAMQASAVAQAVESLCDAVAVALGYVADWIPWA